MGKNLKDVSKGQWGTIGDNPTTQEIQTGCLQRIADATELMAKNHAQLQKDAEYWKTQYYHELNRREAWQRSATSYKAHFTRLKNKLEAMEGNET